MLIAGRDFSSGSLTLTCITSAPSISTEITAAPTAISAGNKNPTKIAMADDTFKKPTK